MTIEEMKKLKKEWGYTNEQVSEASGVPLGTIQKLLDQAKFRLDYIHGEDAVRSIVRDENAVGILVSGIDKHMLFPAVRKNGPLPRKCFSMGEAHEKRYYMEARIITE